MMYSQSESPESESYDPSHRLVDLPTLFVYPIVLNPELKWLEIISVPTV